MDLNTHDLRIRFKSSIIGKKTDKGVEPFYVVDFDQPERKRIVVYGKFAKNGSWNDDSEALDFNPDDFVLDTPKLGLFNVSGSIYLVTRLPIRQYKRGYVKKAVATSNPFNDETHICHKKRVSKDSIALIKAIFNPEYYEPERAIQMINNKEVLSVAINDTFGFGFRYNQKFPVVVYKRHDVGNLIEGRVHLYKKFNHLYEQLSQYVECIRG